MFLQTCMIFYFFIQLQNNRTISGKMILKCFNSFKCAALKFQDSIADSVSKEKRSIVGRGRFLIKFNKYDKKKLKSKTIILDILLNFWSLIF